MQLALKISINKDMDSVSSNSYLSKDGSEAVSSKIFCYLEYFYVPNFTTNTLGWVYLLMFLGLLIIL